jgi:uncharacterized paraquat-inducible protein A
MKDAITVKYRWTSKELEAAQDYHFRHSVRRTFRVALYLIAILMLMLVTSIIGTINKLSPLYPMIGLVGLCWLALRRIERRWTFKRQFKRRPDKDQEVEWQITLDRILAHAPIARSDFTWDAVFKVVRTPEGYLML